MPVLKVKNNNGEWQTIIGNIGGSETNIEVDKSLSMEGMAADAKAVGDAITHLNEEINGSVSNHIDDSIIHITSNERDDWNTAKSHADSDHAPSDAEKNQNAFSVIKFNDMGIVADNTTDIMNITSGNNISFDIGEDGDSIVISANSPAIPTPTSEDNGKFLTVINGDPVWTAVSDADNTKF